ncbi:hypothetical protein [Kocuria palustris]|uniref:hypothetical protein n=1 Tax=Kocuria palustris TaxID=71999 RepID=UPI003D728039
MSESHIYIYENTRDSDNQPAVYIGIGDQLRPYGPHNERATALRDSPATDVMITHEPFSTRRDALRAEAIAIHIASLMGIDVVVDSDNDKDGEMSRTQEATKTAVTNKSALVSTSHLGPAIYTQPGEVDFFDLEQTGLVTLDPTRFGDQGTIHAGQLPEQMAERARKWWSLGKAARNDYAPRRLLAIMKATNVILGDWDLVSDTPIVHFGNDTREFNAFNLTDSTIDDPRGVKGMRLKHFRGSQGVAWSQDISDAHGLIGQRGF